MSRLWPRAPKSDWNRLRQSFETNLKEGTPTPHSRQATLRTTATSFSQPQRPRSRPVCYPQKPLRQGIANVQHLPTERLSTM